MIDHSLAVDSKAPDAQAARADFNRAKSWDLDCIATADEFLAGAWQVLTRPATRSVELCGIVLELASVRGDLASVRRQIEEEAS